MRGPAALQFAPYMTAAFVDPPAAGKRLDEVQSQATETVALITDRLKPVPLIDHLNQQTVGVKLCAELDPATAVHDCVGDQLGAEQCGVVQFAPVEIRRQPVSQPLARQSRRLA